MTNSDKHRLPLQGDTHGIKQEIVYDPDKDVFTVENTLPGSGGIAGHQFYSREIARIGERELVWMNRVKREAR